MISGTFHPSSQEWRYFSREKSLIHTLHLSQLPTRQAGDTVAIASTAPTSNPKVKGFPPLSMPSGPYGGANPTIVTNNSMIIDCYGSVVCNGIILSQSKMGITVGAQGGGLSIIELTPEEAGIFIVHVEAYTDVQTRSYQGAGNDGQLTVQIKNGGTLVAQAIGKAYCAGAGWFDKDTDWWRRMACTCEAMVSGAGSMIGYAYNIGDPADSCMSMWAMKIADFA